MTPYADFLYFGVLLYVVVPAVLAGLTGRFGRTLILAASALMLLVHYARPQAVWDGLTVASGVWLVAGYALFQWGVARGLLALRMRGGGKAAFRCALALSLLPLVVSRLLPLLPGGNDPVGAPGFVGLSYITFRSLDVIFGIADAMILELPAADYLAFLLFFPTISSGPVDRFRRFSSDFRRRRSRREFLDDLDLAVHRLFTGFLYTFVLSALVSRHWLDPSLKTPGPGGALSTMYAYSLHLFFDFAGYSAFAVAFSLLLGVRSPENFDRPFLARNIRDFWNRWHISLSFWFRDHVYNRFVFAAVKGRWFSTPAAASAAGLLLTMGLMGVWHGLAPRYVVYGLYHGVLLVVYEAWVRWKKRTKRVGTGGRLGEAAAVFGTFNLVCFGLLIFSGRLFR